MPLRVRGQVLKQQYGFDCTCIRCQGEEACYERLGDTLEDIQEKVGSPSYGPLPALLTVRTARLLVTWLIAIYKQTYAQPVCIHDYLSFSLSLYIVSTIFPFLSACVKPGLLSFLSHWHVQSR